MAEKQQLDELIQPGNKVRISFGPDGLDPRLLHILAIVDDNYIVHKRWVIGSRWYYEVDHIYYFEIANKRGNLEKVR